MNFSPYFITLFKMSFVVSMVAVLVGQPKLEAFLVGSVLSLSFDLAKKIIEETLIHNVDIYITLSGATSGALVGSLMASEALDFLMLVYRT